jgi:hypothetical protein
MNNDSRYRKCKSASVCDNSRCRKPDSASVCHNLRRQPWSVRVRQRQPWSVRVRQRQPWFAYAMQRQPWSVQIGQRQPCSTQARQSQASPAVPTGAIQSQTGPALCMLQTHLSITGFYSKATYRKPSLGPLPLLLGPPRLSPGPISAWLCTAWP